ATGRAGRTAGWGRVLAAAARRGTGLFLLLPDPVAPAPQPTLAPALSSVAPDPAPVSI
ncbi:MAG: hypothetical protein AVDCRST_MAG88-2562, partial [uncultured Thermomicrobiales bacterium]